MGWRDLFNKIEKEKQESVEKILKMERKEKEILQRFEDLKVSACARLDIVNIEEVAEAFINSLPSGWDHPVDTKYGFTVYGPDNLRITVCLLLQLKNTGYRFCEKTSSLSVMAVSLDDISEKKVCIYVSKSMEYSTYNNDYCDVFYYKTIPLRSLNQEVLVKALVDAYKKKPPSSWWT